MMNTKQMKLDAGTKTEVANVLNAYCGNGKRVRLFYGDKETGRDWGEENDVTGYVSRSTGETPIYILLERHNSAGGGAILTACIVKIVDTASRRVLYQHPTYRVGLYTLCNVSDSKDGYTWRVDRENQNVANFKAKDRAQKYIAFMRGERMAQ